MRPAALGSNEFTHFTGKSSQHQAEGQYTSRRRFLIWAAMAGFVGPERVTERSLFARLAERAMGHTSIPSFDANMRMALRAQSQCRATLEALASIKHPPVIYARQANVTTGPQQVNNGVVAPARKIESGTNELLEEAYGERMDTRAASTAGRSDQAMEAVGTLHGTEDRGG